MRLTIFDYGAGNLHSLIKAVAAPGTNVTIESDPRQALNTDLLLLPGVGAFPQAASSFGSARNEIRSALLDGLPAIGICLGMQLLFDGSEEGAGEGIGLIPGKVTALRAARLPHIGWNSLEGFGEPLTGTLRAKDMYFANSYAARPADTRCVTAWTRHEDDLFAAVVRSHATIGIQFHPEKSSFDGVKFLRAVIADLLGTPP